MMRRILVDHARRYEYAKRGGGAVKISLDEVAVVARTSARVAFARRGDG